MVVSVVVCVARMSIERVCIGGVLRECVLRGCVTSPPPPLYLLTAVPTGHIADAAAATATHLRSSHLFLLSVVCPCLSPHKRDSYHLRRHHYIYPHTPLQSITRWVTAPPQIVIVVVIVVGVVVAAQNFGLHGLYVGLHLMNLGERTTIKPDTIRYNDRIRCNKRIR